MVRSLAAERTSLSEAQAEIERLHLIIKKLQRSQFGRRAERLDDDQLQLGFEDLNADSRGPKPGFRQPGAKTPRRTQDERPSLPAHLPREDVRLDVEHQACPCCGGALHLIGETVSEMLDHVPARLRVIRICRPRYGCRACGTIHQAPAPERPIAKGLATPALLAHVLVSKYCDHLPLYRQSQIFARQGVELDRSTLANWVGGACWWLEPLQTRLAEHVFASQKLFADDTPDPGARSRPRPHQDRPVLGLCPRRPALERTRSAGSGLSLQSRSQGRAPCRSSGQLQGHRSGRRLCRLRAAQRRRQYPARSLLGSRQAQVLRGAAGTGSPVAAEALRRIAELYAIETTIRGQTADARQSVRQSRSLPLVTAMKAWLEMQLAQIPPRGGLADAIRYALSRWDALCRFLDDGRIELDTNTVERAIRPSRSAARTICSPDPMAAPTAGRPSARSSPPPSSTTSSPSPISRTCSNACPRPSMSRLDDLLPWNWGPSIAAQPDHVSGMDAYEL